MSIKLDHRTFRPSFVGLPRCCLNRYYASILLTVLFKRRVGLVASDSDENLKEKKKKKNFLARTLVNFHREIYIYILLFDIYKYQRLAKFVFVFFTTRNGNERYPIVYEPRETTISPLCIFTFPLR